MPVSTSMVNTSASTTTRIPFVHCVPQVIRARTPTVIAAATTTNTTTTTYTASTANGGGVSSSNRGSNLFLGPTSSLTTTTTLTATSIPISIVGKTTYRRGGGGARNNHHQLPVPLNLDLSVPSLGLPLLRKNRSRNVDDFLIEPPRKKLNNTLVKLKYNNNGINLLKTPAVVGLGHNNNNNSNSASIANGNINSSNPPKTEINVAVGVVKSRKGGGVINNVVSNGSLKGNGIITTTTNNIVNSNSTPPWKSCLVSLNGSSNNNSIISPKKSVTARGKKNVVVGTVKVSSIEDEEGDCDPDHCDCGECESDSLCGDLIDQDYPDDFEEDPTLLRSVESSNSTCNNNNNSDNEEDWNSNDNQSNCSSKVNDDDDDYDDDEDDDDETEDGPPSPCRWGVIPCIYCQGGKDHSTSENLIWPVRLDIDLIETLFQLCPDFFEDFDEVEMDPMELANSSPLSIDPSNQPLSVSDSLPSSQVKRESTSSTSNSSASVSGMSAVNAAIETSIEDSRHQQEPQPSPPNVQVDDSPLQPSMDRNKESLKVKLLLRRPMNQLVEQGILPPPKTPAAFAGQRVRLERARMGDFLKVKIQQRPARQELVRQHILEDSNERVAPSLAEKQRMLKRARLADSLNDHLIHRPGPLELVRKNILHAPDAQIEQAIKEGVVEFKPTSEGHIPGPQLPNIYLCGEDESSSDLSSPADTPDHSLSQNSVDSSSANTFAKKDEESNQPSSVTLAVPSSPSLGSTTSTLSPISIVAVTPPPPPPPPPPPQVPSVQPVIGKLQIHLQNIQAASASASLTSGAIPVTAAQINQLVGGSGCLATLPSSQILTQGGNQSHAPSFSSSSKSRSSKKSCKTKSQPKARTIKFHEYKGPPSAQKGGSNQSQQQQAHESSYELLLQQQQLFLQWQLEWQHKYPQIILPAVSKLNTTADSSSQAKLTTNVPVTLQSNNVSRGGTIIAAGTPISFTQSAVPVSTTVSSIQSKPQPIAPAPVPLSTASATSATTTITIPVQTTVPMQVAVTEIKQKVVNSGNSDNNCSQQPSGAVVSGKVKLNDWKVSDLKAELKRRNLPVSGSKPQLVERLRQADATVQDEAVSTTTPPPKMTVDESSPGKADASSPSATLIKTEIDESSSSNDLMDISEPSNTNNDAISNVSVSGLTGKQVNSCSNNNRKFGNVHVNQGITKSTGTMGGNFSATQNADSANAGDDSKVKIDENLIREQQKQIEQLQQALKNSQHQLQQMKSSQVTGGQKHRLALQQHLQQKMQQQALQAQLQKLIQLHSMQQQQKVIQIAQLAGSNPPLTIQPAPQQQNIQPVEPIQNTLRSPQSNTTRATTEELNKQAMVSAMNIISAGLQQQQAQPITKQVPNIPFTIVKLATIPTKTVATATATIPSTQEISQQEQHNGPQIVLTHSAVVTSSSESQNPFQEPTVTQIQGERDDPVKWVSSSEATDSDSMDHSWLLKINEVPASDANEEIPKNVSDFLVTFDASNDGKSLIKDTSKGSGAQKKEGFKSQMVDDVLEILIRNGELPPSAAQEPQTPTTPCKAGTGLAYPIPTGSNNAQNMLSTASQSSTTQGIVPPPPPLPPATFAVTLPTSMTFSRNQNAVLTQIPTQSTNFLPVISTALDATSMTSPTPSILDILQESHPKLTIPMLLNFDLSQHKEPLSKEAEDILKISNDLSNFGREHAESEQRYSNLLRNSSKFHSTPLMNDDSRINEVDDSNSLSLLLGEVEKDLHLVDDMDVVLDDHSPVTQVDTGNREKLHDNVNSIPMSVDSLHQNNNESRKQDDDFLDELGLLHSDLNVPMPMEMDYTDWLENLLPTNTSNSINSTTNPAQQLQAQHTHHLPQTLIQTQNLGSHNHRHPSLTVSSNPTENVGANFNNNKGLSNENCNTFFGVSSMDFCSTLPNTGGNSVVINQNQSTQRDPLLSSTRTFDIFSTANADNETGVVGGFSNLDANNASIGLVADLKGNNGAPMSPMSDSLLWDFAM